jgi:hypothetical protein
MKVNINQVWDDTLAFIRAERSLVVPVALGTLYLAAVVVIAASVFLPQGLRGFVLLVATAWGIVGQLALIDLTRGAGRSVSEALGVGVQRLPFTLLIYMMLGFLFILATLPILMALTNSGLTVEQLTVFMTDQAQLRKLGDALPPWVALYMMALAIAGLFVFVRLLLWKAAIVELRRPIAALKDSWARTRGHFWALFGLVLIAGIVVQLVSWALETALGATFLLLGRALGSPVLAQIVPALIIALVSTAFQAVITIFLALYYRRSTV